MLRPRHLQQLLQTGRQTCRQARHSNQRLACVKNSVQTPDSGQAVTFNLLPALHHQHTRSSHSTHQTSTTSPVSNESTNFVSDAGNEKSNKRIFRRHGAIDQFTIAGIKERRARNCYLGQSAFNAYAMDIMVREQPEMHPQWIVDICQGLFRHDQITNKLFEDFASSEYGTLGGDVLELLGEQQLSGDNDTMHATLDEILNRLQSLSGEEIQSLILHMHPKLVLSTIARDNDYRINLDWTYQGAKENWRKKEFTVVGTITNSEGELVASGEYKNKDLSFAEKEVVNKLLKQVQEQAKQVSVEYLEETPESEVEQLNLVFDQERIITFFKPKGERFGLHLRGGNVVDRVEDSRYVAGKMVSPVFVAGIEPESAAWYCGKFKVGDKLFAVNDWKLQGKDHDEVVEVLARVSNLHVNDGEFRFVVQHDPDIAAEEVLMRQFEKSMMEDKIDLSQLGPEWNLLQVARATQLPRQYAIGESQIRKRPKFQTWKPSRRNCIWRPKGYSPKLNKPTRTNKVRGVLYLATERILTQAEQTYENQ